MSSEPDSNGHSLIDQVYDGLDKFVTGAGHALGVDVNAPTSATPPTATASTASGDVQRAPISHQVAAGALGGTKH